MVTVTAFVRNRANFLVQAVCHILKQRNPNFGNKKVKQLDNRLLEQYCCNECDVSRHFSVPRGRFAGQAYSNQSLFNAHFALLEPDNLPLWIDCISFAASKDICVLLEVVSYYEHAASTSKNLTVSCGCTKLIHVFPSSHTLVKKKGTPCKAMPFSG